MAFKDETINIEHGIPKKVEFPNLEAELKAIWEAGGDDARTQRANPRSLTLVICTNRDELAQPLGRMVGEVITHNPARALVIRPEPTAEPHGIEAWISTHCVTRGDTELQLCCEQIWLNARGKAVEDLHSTIARLRLSDLPLVVWWRGQPDFDDRLFAELVKSADHMILDSTRFTARAEKINRIIARLRREFTHVTFGDINWERIAPWRELVAQFFDVSAHLAHLEQLSALDIEYSSSEGGNPSQAILLMAWMAAQLGWRPVHGSYRRRGADRHLAMRSNEREIKVNVRARAELQIAPGLLAGVTLRAEGEPSAQFSLERREGDEVAITTQIGEAVVERMTMLEIPDEASLVCSELDAPQHDRVYHRVLEILENSLAE